MAREEDLGNDEAPPPYSAYADQSTEQTAEFGPSRPFADDGVRLQRPSHSIPHSVSPSVYAGGSQSPLPQPPPRHHSQGPLNRPGPSADRPTVGLYGKTLVYPPGYVCPKCTNSGFKHNNPGHPCSRCWETYGKKNPGPAIHAPGVSFQRPLTGRTTINAAYGQAPFQQGYAMPPAPSPAPMPMPFQPMPMHTMGPMGHGISVLPGDPRIGGYLCQHCRGSGVIEMSFLFGESTCPYCRGVGRVF